ncbi:MAG: ABC transporter ATP-binding protein [Alphaproteobacteria bacterium]|nr:ABC transporter ATP-binding protein [Alphaproteobacteria bacterium]
MSLSQPAIRVRDLSKAYLVYDRPEDRLKQMFLRGFKKLYREFWALRGISFDIARGETVGILGRNGSGKTTLLEIISGTVTPSGGTVEVDGQVAALLGLGAGFNPEFSGRENVILNATLLGLDGRQIAERMDMIVAFADIGPFLDQPVKTYSSGMYSRLAFAVAIHADPDILVVDESLSVGDEAFQRKCFARINQLKAKGRTILFVTHNSRTVVELCDRAILLDHGERLLTGSPRAVVAQYHRLVYAPPGAHDEVRERVRALDRSGEAEAPAVPVETSDADEDDAFLDPNMVSTSMVEYQPNGAVIGDVHIETPRHERVNNLVHGREYHYCYRVRFDRCASGVTFGMLLRTISGIEVAGRVSHLLGQGIDAQAGREVEVRFPFRAILVPGTYFANAGVVSTETGEMIFLHRLVDALMFRILPEPDLMVAGLVDCGGQAASVRDIEAPS